MGVLKPVVAGNSHGLPDRYSVDRQQLLVEVDVLDKDIAVLIGFHPPFTVLSVYLLIIILPSVLCVRWGITEFINDIC